MITVANKPTSSPTSWRLRLLFERAPQPYIVTDVHGTIQQANHAAHRFLQGPDSLTGTALATLLPVESRRRLRRFMARLHPDESSEAFFDLRTTTGDATPCRTSATLVVDG